MICENLVGIMYLQERETVGMPVYPSSRQGTKSGVMLCVRIILWFQTQGFGTKERRNYRWRPRFSLYVIWIVICRPLSKLRSETSSSHPPPPICSWLLFDNTYHLLLLLLFWFPISQFNHWCYAPASWIFYFLDFSISVFSYLNYSVYVSLSNNWHYRNWSINVYY